MSSKPRWACASCGMYSSTRSSVKRHIQNLHNGNANLVSFIDYLAGRRTGYYWPNLVPTYQRKDHDNKKIDYTKIMKDEILRDLIRKRLGNL